MDKTEMLTKVKNSLGITGDYMNDTIEEWMNETIEFIKDAGVSENLVTVGIVARGVSDLWNYGAGDAEFSSYFKMRVSQLALKSGGDENE